MRVFYLKVLDLVLINMDNGEFLSLGLFIQVDWGYVNRGLRID